MPKHTHYRHANFFTSWHSPKSLDAKVSTKQFYVSMQFPHIYITSDCHDDLYEAMSPTQTTDVIGKYFMILQKFSSRRQEHFIKHSRLILTLILVSMRLIRRP